MTDPIESQRGAIRALNSRLQRLEAKKQEIQMEIDRVNEKIAEHNAILRAMYERKNQES